MKKVIIAVALILGVYALSTGQTKIASNQSDRDGSSYEKAIIIKAKNEGEGIRSEYVIISKLYPNYKMKSQGTGSKNNKNFDRISIVTDDGKEVTIYFDITNFNGKF